MSRAALWNWQEGVKAGLDLIRSKRQITATWMDTQKTAAGTQNPLQSLTVGRVTFADKSNRTMDYAVAMKAYNGLRNAPSDWIDTLPAPPGFSLDNYYKENYCAWKDGTGWVLNRWKQPLDPKIGPINYVQLVCEQVED